MDRGGTITWYLNANDTDFMATLTKARAEARAAGDDIDRSLNKGTQNASKSVKNLDNDTTSLSTTLRTVRKDVVGLGGDSNSLNASLVGSSNSSRTLANALGSTALTTNGLRGSLANLSNESRGLNTSLGGTAIRNFNSNLGGTSGTTKKVAADVRGAKLSLDDFNRSMGQSATNFRNFQIALRGFELTALIVAASVAAGALIELAGAVAALTGILATVPAFVGVAAGAIATLKIATGGVGDAFKKLIKPVTGATAAQNLQKRQSDITAAAMRRDADLVRRLTDLNEQYGETLQELAEERMRMLNEQILEGVDAWEEISRAANDYLDISNGLKDQQLEVAQAQAQLNLAIFEYGQNSQQAIEASRKLYAAQGDLAQSTADMDEQFAGIKDNVKDLATNLGSLQRANRNQLSATLANLRALKLDKQIRGENVDEVGKMIAVMESLINVKDTNLTTNVDTAAAQKQLDSLKDMYPDIAVAAQDAASSTEKSLTKSLQNITESMQDVRRERAELQSDLASSLSDAAEQSAIGAQGDDPFAGLSANARSFVIALKEVYDAFQPIKMTIQDKFFAGLDTEIRNIAYTSFPVLQTGLGNIATAMNGMAKEASRVIQEPFFQGAMANSMQTTADSTNILTRAVEPLAKAFTDLMNIGNPYVKMLAEWVVRQSEAAAAFTGSEQGQKKLNEAINLGIDALKQIMDLVGSVGSLFYNVFKTANDSGGGILKTLTELVDAANAWVKSAEGQELLASLFEASNKILKEYGEAVGGVLKFLLEIIKAYNDMDGPAKDVITNMIVYAAVLTPVLTYVSSLLASWKLLWIAGREGVQVMGAMYNAYKAAPAAMAGFKAGMDGIKVANEGAAGTFGKVGNAVGGIRDAFKNGVSHVAEFGKNIASTAADVGRKAGTIAADGAKAVGGWVVSGAKIAAGWVAGFATMIARGVVAVATMVAQAAIAAGAWIAGAIATAAAWVVANAAMLGIWGLIILAIVGAVALIIANWDTIINFFKGVWEGIQKGVSGLINWVTENWPLLLAILTGPIGIAAYLIITHWETIKRAFGAAWEFIKGVWSQVTGFFGGIGQGISNIFWNVVTVIQNAFNTAINWIRGVPGQIFGALGNLGNMLANSGWSLIMGLWHGIQNAFGYVKNWTSGLLKSLRNLFPFSPAKEGPFSGSGYTSHSGKALMEDFGKGIVDASGGVVGTVENIVGTVADSFSGLATEIGTMQTDFGLSANSAMSADITQDMAPPVLDKTQGEASLGTTGNNVTINQTNEVNTELDMGVINRNLVWELNKL